jgi:hypothetical protein
MEWNRRGFLGGVAGAAGLIAVPSIVRANTPDTRLFELARRELERTGNRVWLKDKVGIADFSKPSSQPRFYILDMVAGVVHPYFVAHGRGSDPEHDGWLKNFSNDFNSNATSRGAYLTRTWYDGKHGTSMRLWGLDADNNNAEDRAIVIHGAWYANPSRLVEWGKLGRSEGCFAFPEANLMEVIGRLGPGRMIFADRV